MDSLLRMHAGDVVHKTPAVNTTHTEQIFHRRHCAHLDMVQDAVSVEVCMQPGWGQVQLAQGAPAVQVHGLDALLQVRHQHIGRLIRVPGGGAPPWRPSPRRQGSNLQHHCFAHIEPAILSHLGLRVSPCAC